MIVGVPVVIPATIPVVAPTVANAVLLLLQEPPVGDPLKVVVWPRHNAAVPEIEGDGLTTIVTVALQPVASV